MLHINAHPHKTRGYFRPHGENGCLPLTSSAELWFLRTALLLNYIYPPMKFQVNSPYRVREDRIKYENKGQYIQNYDMQSNGSCALHFSSRVDKFK